MFAVCLLIKILLIYGLQGKLMEKGFVHAFVLEYDFLNKSLLNQITVFLAGIASYQYISSGNSARHISNKMIVVAFILIILSCFLLNSKSYVHTPFTGLLYPVLSAIAFALISIRLAAAEEFKGLFSAVLVRLGQLSFSMYLVHFFILDVFTLIFEKSIYAVVGVPELRIVFLYPAVILATFVISKMTYSTVEKRGIEIGGKLIRKLNR